MNNQFVEYYTIKAIKTNGEVICIEEGLGRLTEEYIYKFAIDNQEADYYTTDKKYIFLKDNDRGFVINDKEINKEKKEMEIKSYEDVFIIYLDQILNELKELNKHTTLSV